MENLRDMNIKHNMSTCDLVQVHGGSRGMVIHPMMGIPFQMGISIGIMVIYTYIYICDILVGGFNPLKNMKVSWGDYSENSFRAELGLGWKQPPYSRRKPPAPSVMDSGMNVFLALIGHFLAPYEAILAPYEGMLAPFEAMLAPCEPIWGSCWAYVGPILDPFLAYIGPDQEFWPLLKNMQKHRILEQKCPPPS